MGWEWILVPLLLLVAAGWCIFYISGRNKNQSLSASIRNIPPEYLKGLNYVLNEEQDKAIDIFIRMLEVDSNTVETHLALGNLFRRRGEVDRAIRIHQNLIARPALNEEQRSLALMELGLDYMRSGLLDRAESLFTELAGIQGYSVQANTELLNIYQQEKDWLEAVNTARQLQKITGDNLSAQIAQFYCELAEENTAAGELREARDYIRKALSIDPGCVRASLLEAENAYNDGRIKQAIKSYRRVEKQDPEYIHEIIEPIMACYRDIDRIDEGRAYLQEILERYGGITPLLHLTRIIEESKGEKEAIRFISTELSQRPTVRGVDKLIEYILDMADGEIRENLKTVKELTSRLLQDNPVYKCHRCGFDAKLMHWQCPSCKNWSSIKPVFGVAGE